MIPFATENAAWNWITDHAPDENAPYCVVIDGARHRVSVRERETEYGDVPSIEIDEEEEGVMDCEFCKTPMAFEWQTFESQARGQWCCRRCGESVKQHDEGYRRPALAWFVGRVDGSSGLRVREQLERHYRGLLTETEVEMIVRAAWHRWHQGISLRMAREHEISDHGGALRCTCGWQFAPADAEWKPNATYTGPDLSMRGRVRVLAPGVIEFWRGDVLCAASGLAAGDYELDEPELDEAARKALASEFVMALEALAG